MPLSEASVAIVGALKRHIIELHAEWKTLLELFGTETTTKSLHRAAPALFDTLYRTLIRDVLLGVARLTDPLTTAGRDNLVLERLAQLPEVTADSGLSAQVVAKLSEVKEKAKALRDYRNKYLAHLDLQASLSPIELVPGVNRDDVEAVLEAIAELFNIVDGALRDRTLMFSNVAVIGGAQHLLRLLEDAEAFKELPLHEQTRLRSLSGAIDDA